MYNKPQQDLPAVVMHFLCVGEGVIAVRADKHHVRAQFRAPLRLRRRRSVWQDHCHLFVTMNQKCVTRAMPFEVSITYLLPTEFEASQRKD